MVCGPIGDRGIRRILKMIEFLEKNGFQTIKQFSKAKEDYSHIHDFRRKKELAQKIIRHDYSCVKKADVFVVLPEPSFGAAIEMFLAKKLKKKVILFSDKPMSSPWPIKFSDFVITNKNDLVTILNRIK